MNHTPEPWFARDLQILPANYVLTGAPIATVHVRKKREMQIANVRRIVACVNACEGSSTEWLEFQTSEDMAEQFWRPEPFQTRDIKILKKGLEYMEQRDRLLDALQAAVDRQAYREGSGPHWWEHARAVIADTRGTP